jgi:circadian clock protein KaiB
VSAVRRERTRPGAGAGVREVERRPGRGDSARTDRQPQRAARYVLRLYVTGASRTSRVAVERVREICERRLEGRYELEVIDIYQLPALAKDEQIIATPTLIRVLPAPLRRFIGDLSRVEKIFFGLDLREKTS